jgi:hypothetical protein
MGSETDLFSGKEIKSLESHPNLEEIKSLITGYMTSFKEAYHTTEELKILTDVRFKVPKIKNITYFFVQQISFL